MKHSTKNALVVALSLAAVTPARAFMAPAMSAASSMKRPLVTSAATGTTPTAMWNSMQPDQDEMDVQNKRQRSNSPTPALFNLFEDASNKRNVLMAGAALVTALSVAPMPSDAAMSGGRMGGSSFRPSMSRSYSAPSASRGYSRGYSSYGSGYSRPIMPFVAPISPFYSPYGYGGGVMSYSRGPNLLPLFLLGGAALAVSNVVGGIGRSSASFFEEERSFDSVLGGGTSVVKMSVALDVSDRDDPNSILSVLERLATTARTDSRVGIQNLSSQIALELLRRKSSITSASTEFRHFQSRDKAQREFNSLSVEERGKFEKETISKFGGVDYSSGESRASSSGFNDKATMAVVTLVLAIDGDSTKVPQIRSMNDVENALRKIASDVKVSDCLQGAEILWTPEERTETLAFRDVIADYPELNTV